MEQLLTLPSTALFKIFAKMCQNLKSVAIMHGDHSSLQLAAVLRLLLPSSEILTCPVYNPNKETRKLKTQEREV
jgi:hypothetical protein